ncbi:hypothetical protein J6590_046981 [Homalodisca vitripennis]|nr:hypothetical protein J6590_046981 [Homalodisca vitripennis]
MHKHTKFWQSSFTDIGTSELCQNIGCFDPHVDNYRQTYSRADDYRVRELHTTRFGSEQAQVIWTSLT